MPGHLAFLWHRRHIMARWIREEAAMAAITLDSALRKSRPGNSSKPLLAAYREMLDTFVSNQLRQAAAEAEHARPRQPRSHHRNRKIRQ